MVFVKIPRARSAFRVGTDARYIYFANVQGTRVQASTLPAVLCVIQTVLLVVNAYDFVHFSVNMHTKCMDLQYNMLPREDLVTVVPVPNKGLGE